MGDGDNESSSDETDSEETPDEETPDETADEQATAPVSPATFEQRLDDTAAAVEEAETEDDLDDAEATLDTIESDLEDATFDTETEGESEEADETDDDESDEGDEDPRENLEERISDLRDDIEQQRGPYAQDVTDAIADAREIIKTSELTEQGRSEAVTGVESFCETAEEPVNTGAVAGDSTETAIAALEAVTDATEAQKLDADEDADAIATLLEAAETLASKLEDAQVFDDLELREQFDRRGFYDVLEPDTRRDFPPEWNAIKLYEARGEPGPILDALEAFDSDFMEENALDALEHIAPPEAYDQVHALAQRRNEQPVRILGRIGDERACETLHDFLGGGDISLELTTLDALGAIGSAESTEPIAQRLVADNAEVRSAAARALGLLGDTRAIEPLSHRLAEDDDERVRASAAWALNQIGTERALTALESYADDRSYLVQAEAEKV